MLEHSFHTAINTAFNKALSLDPELPEKLAIFSGKVICLYFTGVGKQLYLLPENAHINVLTKYDGEADVCIRGTPLAIIKMLMKPDVTGLLLKGEVEISGDTRLGNAFKSLFREMEIDWQQPLAEIVGDSATQEIENGFNQFNQWCRKSAAAFGLSLSEYLQEESRDMVGEAEVENFTQQVDRLRDDIDRFEYRLTMTLQEKNQ